MISDEVLFLVNNNSYFAEIIGKYFATCSLWKRAKFNRTEYYLRRTLGFHESLYGFDKKIIKEFNKILLTENNAIQKVSDDLIKYNPQAEIKFWMWNIVDDYGAYKIRNLQSKGIECYTFDKNDCAKYGMTYNFNLYPYDENYCKAMDLKPEYDLYFIGKDKARMAMIMDLKQYLDSVDVSYNFKVVIDNTSDCYLAKNVRINKVEEQNMTYFFKNISYKKVLEDISKCRCIVDITQEKQIGLTWRPFEALFYNKKLITNNESIRNYDFYNTNNILILKGNNYNLIKEFLNRPLYPINKAIKQRYSIEQWMQNFWRNS